ncbi:UNVERIFIED_CONTAM: hypothetical protein HDU68_010239, partial [Siphonaria sp. JEL0065]
MALKSPTRQKEIVVITSKGYSLLKLVPKVRSIGFVSDLMMSANPTAQAGEGSKVELVAARTSKGTVVNEDQLAFDVWREDF